MKLPVRASLLMLLVLAGCDLPLDSEPAGDGFSIYAALGQVRLANNTPNVVHYVIWSEGAVVDLNPDPEEWPSVQAGEVRRIPYGEIRGASREVDRAVVYWWNGEGGFRGPERVRLR